MKRMHLLIIVLMAMMVSCTTTPKIENPFFETYDTPFGVPPFDKIKLEHLLPAFREGIKQQETEISAIVTNAEVPTFANTIEAMEYSGDLIKRVSAVYSNYLSSNTSDELEKIAQEVAPMLSAHEDNISLNPELFKKVEAVFNQRNELNLSPEQSKLLEETFKGFVRKGAALTDEQKIRYREINQELSLLSLKFGQNVMSDVNNFKLFIENQADLAGLPQSSIDAAAQAATDNGKPGQWLFTVHNPSVMPFLTYASNRGLRETMNKAHVLRGNNNNEFDNKQIINRMIELRLERGKMLGYDNYADFVLSDRMAKNKENVYAFLQKIWNAALPIAQQEAKDLQALINKQNDKFKLEYWDWRYFTEKLRKEKYDLDEEEISQYFEINSVRDGIFMVAEKLWGLKFVQRLDVPVYHADATAWEVLEADGTHIGILYMDMHPRTSKRSGAWMSSYRDQHIAKDGKYVHPVITIVCNFTAPAGDKPALLTLDETQTFFHEMGHALHGLLSNTTYNSLSGTNTPTDFVELPSQIMENWANDPLVLKMYAKHYATGEPMPDALIEKIIKSSHFNQGFTTVEFTASAFLDMDYYTKTTFEPFDVNAFESDVKKRYNMMDEIAFRHSSTHFQHIFPGMYIAGYYSYIWAGVLDADAYEAFRETGNVFDATTAAKFRNEILSRGGTRNAMDMYIAFRGKEPGIEPLLRQRGLLR